MGKSSAAESTELTEDLTWSLQYKDYFDHLNRRAEAKAEEGQLTPQEQLERGEIQKTRLHDILAREVKQVRLNVQGQTRTNTSFLIGEFDFTQVKTIADACKEAQHGVQNIESFGIVNEANILIDSSDDPGVLDVTIKLKEVNRLDTLEVKAEHTSSDVSGNVGWKVRNVLGNAETLSASGKLSTEPSIGIGSSFLGRSSIGLNLDFFKPRAFGTTATINFNLFKALRNCSINSSYFVHASGSNVTYTSPDRKHSLTYGLEHRNSNTGSSGVSPPVVKSFLRYAFERDTRDSKVIPSRGHILSAAAEIAGFGGNVQFVKAETAASYHQPWENLFTINVGARGGIIIPLGNIFSGADTKTRFCDRIPCGGALISRGWQQGAIGPRDQCDYMNGDLCASAGVSATGPVSNSPLFWHGFVGATSGSLHSETTPRSNLLSTFFNRARVSAGASLVFPLGTGRLEVGVAQSIIGDRIDTFSRFFWGFGIHFL
jgi:outer membrane protein assembly factor BamA